MTNHHLGKSIIALLLLIPISTAVAAADCPVTAGSDGAYVKGWPAVDRWFGSRYLALMLPENGIWATTKPGHRISIKLFWYVEGYEPGRENGFSATIKRLDDGENDAVISSATNAGGPNLGAWTVLTGIDFPSEGCWEISAEFEGASLTFVVKTVTPVYR